MEADPPPLVAEEIVAALERHEVRYVLVGGLAVVLHGGAHVTFDADITPDPDRANLDRLSSALRDLEARVWTGTEPDGLPFSHDGASLAQARVWNLVTRAGRFDITFVPSGTQGYEDLVRDAVEVRIGEAHATVASLADIVRSKEAADRPKDRLSLPYLRRLLEEHGPKGTLG